MDASDISLVEKVLRSIDFAKKSLDRSTNQNEKASEKISKLVSESEQQINRLMEQGIKEALEKFDYQLSDKFKQAMADMNHSVYEFRRHKSDIVNQTKFLTWKYLAGFIVFLVAVLGFVGKYSIDTAIEAKRLAAKNADLESKIAARETILQTHVSACGNSPCIRIDKSTEPWSDGTNDYIKIKTDN